MNSFSIFGILSHTHLHGQQTFSHSMPKVMQKKRRKNERNSKKTKERKTRNFAHKSEKWTLGGIYARTRAHSTFLRPAIVCQQPLDMAKSSNSSTSPNKAKPQRQTPAAYSQRAASGMWRLFSPFFFCFPNLKNIPKPKRNQNEHVFQLKTLSGAQKFI